MNSYPYYEGQPRYDGQPQYSGPTPYQGQPQYEGEQFPEGHPQYDGPYQHTPEQQHNVAINVHPPDRAYSRNGSREDTRPPNFNFEFQGGQDVSLDQRSPGRPPLRAFPPESQTNSIYADSFSTTLQYDSRHGSRANLIARSGSATPGWGHDSQTGSQLGLSKAAGDFSDFGAASPKVRYLCPKKDVPNWK
jgi:hypothetical protein